MARKKQHKSKKLSASKSSSSTPQGLLKGELKANVREIEADTSRPAAYLRRDEPYSAPERMKADQSRKENDFSSTNPWANSKGIVKKVPKTNPQESLNEQSNLILERNFRQNRVEFLRQGLKNLGNTCFCNALFQCLFDVPLFRDSILKTSQSRSQPLLLGDLTRFFENLQKRSKQTQQAYSKFVKNLFDKRKDQFQIGTQGDSYILFRTLLEELTIEGGSEDLPYLKIFRGGDLVKNVECPECHEKKTIIETLQILDSMNEIRVCRNCRERRVFICQYEVKKFPEILVIKVHETRDCEEQVKVIPIIEFERMTLKGNNTKVKYGLLSAVVNELRGEKGYHSMELSYQKGKYFVVDDHRDIKQVRLEDLKSDPKLLFYKKM